MAIIDDIATQVEIFKENLQNVLQQRNLIDTKKAFESLRVESGSNYVRLIGVDYLEFLDRGSRPWSDKSPKSVKKLGYILQVSGWAERKGVNPYAVASVIVKKGSQIFRGKRAGIELDELIKDFQKDLNEAIRTASLIEIKRGLNKFN